MKLVQKTGQRKLTRFELFKVHSVKASHNAWFLCSACGHLSFEATHIKYCNKCGYNALEKVIVEGIEDEYYVYSVGDVSKCENCNGEITLEGIVDEPEDVYNEYDVLIDTKIVKIGEWKHVKSGEHMCFNEKTGAHPKYGGRYE